MGKKEKISIKKVLALGVIYGLCFTNISYGVRTLERLLDVHNPQFVRSWNNREWKTNAFATSMRYIFTKTGEELTYLLYDLID